MKNDRVRGEGRGVAEVACVSCLTLSLRRSSDGEGKDMGRSEREKRWAMSEISSRRGCVKEGEWRNQTPGEIKKKKNKKKKGRWERVTEMEVEEHQGRRQKHLEKEGKW